MRTLKLSSVLKRTTTQINFYDVVTNSYYDKSKGWTARRITITDKNKQSILSALDMKTGKAFDRLERWLDNENYSAIGNAIDGWALKRIIYCKHRKGFTYCAGQDFVSETRSIKAMIRKY